MDDDIVALTEEEAAAEAERLAQKVKDAPAFMIWGFSPLSRFRLENSQKIII